MRIKFILVPLLLAAIMSGLTQQAVAQIEGRERPGTGYELPELETDRDAFTPASSVVGYGLAVLETSYSFIDNRDVAETHSFPELLVRHGISERTELRIGWNYEIGGAGNTVSGNGAEQFEVGTIERESQFLYGFKTTLTEQAHWRPRSAVIVQGFTPTSGEATATDIVVAYAFGWELENRWRLDYSIRYATETLPEDSFNEWAPSVILRMPLSEEWQTHIEYFGLFSDGAEREFSRSYISPGAHYLMTENLELGLRVGWGITEDAPNFFANVGVGWRF